MTLGLDARAPTTALRNPAAAAATRGGLPRRGALLASLAAGILFASASVTSAADLVVSSYGGVFEEALRTC